MTMRKPRKHKFRLRLYRQFSTIGWGNFRSAHTYSIRINRAREAALQRIIRDLNETAPDGWRYVLSN